MIHIIDDWYLDSDDGGKGIVMKRNSGRVDKENNVVYLEHFYPSSIDKGIERLCKIYQNKATNDNEMELLEYLKLCKEINNDFKKILGGLKEVTEIGGSE